MPQITINRHEFERLVGKKLPIDKLKDRISMIGTDLDEITDDEIKVEIFPNRPDMLSEQGFARAFSSFIGEKTGLIHYKTHKPLQNYKVIIEKSVEKVRPYTACAIIKGLSLDDEKIREIMQIQEKLHVSYGRQRKRVAIGIYPLEKITLPIIYKALKPGEIKFIPLETDKISKEEKGISETKKLFWENPYLSYCKAKITKIDDKKVKLDQTILYAFSGGQESDSGTINGIRIINALKQGDKESIVDIEYELEKNPNFKVNDIVEIEIDTEKRKNLMKLHSAAHISYYFITEKLGKLKIVGSNITSKKARVDFEYDKSLTEILNEIESNINNFLKENHQIIITNDEKNNNLKWWSCKNWKMPCGGTHVKNTKEIGKIQLKRKNIGAGKERIEICLIEDGTPIDFQKETYYNLTSKNASLKEMTANEILEHHPKGKEFSHLLKNEEVYPIFIDAKGSILSMPPIINSNEVGKVIKDTKEVFIECSGHDFDVLSKCLNFIVTSFADMGAEIYEMELDYYNNKRITPNLTPRKIKVDKDYINNLLGLELKEYDFKEYFERMGYDYIHGDVLVPAWRADILHQVDLAEDVAIAYGYEKFNETIPNVATIGQEDKFESFKNKIINILVGLGFLETNTFCIINKDDQTVKMKQNYEIIELLNSVSLEHNSLRYSMIPSLMQVLQNNKHHEYPQNIFEAGMTFSKTNNTETGVKEEIKLAVVLCSQDIDYTRIRQIIDLIFEAINEKYDVFETQNNSFVKGRVAKIQKEEKDIAYLGELHPETLEKFDITMPTAALEINLTELFNIISK